MRPWPRLPAGSRLAARAAERREPAGRSAGRQRYDPRIRTLAYDPDQVVPADAAIFGYQTDDRVRRPDERIENGLHRRFPRLAGDAEQESQPAVPQADVDRTAATSMTVVTDRRRYACSNSLSRRAVGGSPASAVWPISCASPTRRNGQPRSSIVGPPPTAAGARRGAAQQGLSTYTGFSRPPRRPMHCRCSTTVSSTWLRTGPESCRPEPQLCLRGHGRRRTARGRASPTAGFKRPLLGRSRPGGARASCCATASLRSPRWSHRRLAPMPVTRRNWRPLAT